MLVLTRRENESLLIGGNVRVCLLEIGPGWVRLGVDAPQDIPILRDEVAERDKLVLPDLSVSENGGDGR